MSQSLIVYPTNDDNMLNIDIVLQKLEDMPGSVDVGEISESEYASHIGCYKHNNTEANFTILKNDIAISISGGDKAALNFALNLQKVINIDLSMTDDCYSFSCLLNKVSSTEMLQDIISQGLHSE